MNTKVKIITIFAFAFFVSAFVVIQAETQTKTETAGQKFKSIKVLNDMPADQMGKVMNMMAASLGVNCAFCHASNDGDYEKEEIKHKDTAREMLRMTFELNKNYFEGRPEINCNTCHQGKSHPRPSFPLKPVDHEIQPAQPENKPTVDEILAKYEKALGGKANISKITSRRITAKRVEPDGKTFENEVILQKGSKLLITTIYPSKEFGDYVVREGFDGKLVWKTGNNQAIELKADESEQIRREAQLFANSDLKSIYPKMDFRSVEIIEGRSVYLIMATTESGLRERLHFDLLSGFLVRRSANTPTILGNFVFQVDYLNYKNFGGVKLPTTMNFAVPNISWTRRLLKVTNNAIVEDAKFLK